MKNLSKLGKMLSKAEQLQVNGGASRCWDSFNFPSEGKCNHYCGGTCSPSGPTSPYGFTPHICSDNCN